MTLGVVEWHELFILKPFKFVRPEVMEQREEMGTRDENDSLDLVAIITLLILLVIFVCHAIKVRLVGDV